MNVICCRPARTAQRGAVSLPSALRLPTSALRQPYIYQRRIRSSRDPASGQSDPFPEPSTWKHNHKQEVSVEEHPVITGARRGDLIRVLRYAENRHNLEVRDFQMTLFHKNPLPTDEPLEADSEEGSDP